MDKISIVIPVYNVEQYLAECVQSVLNQTYSNLEIVLIDDGSTDASGSICDALAVQDARIFVVHKSNSGVSDARNIGIAHASGKYIAFIDSDDWVAENYIERLYTALIMTESQVAVSGLCEFFEDSGNIITHTLCNSDCVMTNTRALDCAVDKNRPFVGYAGGKLYLKSVICDSHVRFDTDLTLNEDSLFNYKVFHHARKVVLLNECLYNYRIRKTSATRSASRMLSSYHTRIVAFRRAIELSKEYPGSKFEKRVHFALFESIAIYINYCYATGAKNENERDLINECHKAYKKADKQLIGKKLTLFYLCLRISPAITRRIIAYLQK